MTCPRCHGTGAVRVLDVFGDVSTDACPRCDGRGEIAEERTEEAL